MISATKQFTTASSFALTSTMTKTDLQTKASGITVYPNPAKHSAVSQFISSKPGDYSIEFTDVSGKVFQTKSGKLSTGVNRVRLVLAGTPGMFD